VGGLAWSFVSLLGARALVGVGEAAYGTIAPSLLADYFPRQYRGRVFSIFFAAIPVGTALGYVIGGALDVRFGWRSAFFFVGAPGLALAALSLRLYDPPRGIQDPTDALRASHRLRGAARAAYAALARNRPYVLTVLGYAAYTFALGGMAVFLPKFLIRVRQLPEGPATLWSGITLALTGFVGTFAGGWIGDRLLPATRQAYLWVSGVATLVAARVESCERLERVLAAGRAVDGQLRVDASVYLAFRVVERWHEHGRMRHVEVGIARRQPLAIELEGGRHRQVDDLEPRAVLQAHP